jgi:hypothetical protein
MARLLRTAALAGAAYGLWVWLKSLLDEPPHPIGQDDPPAPSPKQSASSNGGGGATKAELYERAQELDIEGRSKMSKAQLERAIRDAG